jgi:hypothetical protein
MKNGIMSLMFIVYFAFPMLGGNLKHTSDPLITAINAYEKAKDTLFIKGDIKLLPFGLTGESVVNSDDRVMYSDSLFYVSFGSKSDIKVFDPNGNGGCFLKKALPDLGEGVCGRFKFVNYCIYQGLMYVLLSSGAINVYDTKTYKLIQKIKKPIFYGTGDDIFVDAGFLYIVSSFNAGQYVNVFTRNAGNLTKIDSLGYSKIYTQSMNFGNQVNKMTITNNNGFHLIGGDTSNSFFYNQSFGNLLYRFKNGKVNKTINLDFGSYVIPSDSINGDYGKLEFLRKKREIRFLNSYAQKGKYILFDIQNGLYDNQKIFGLYNNEINKIVLYKSLILTRYNCEIKVIGACSSGFIGIIDKEIAQKKQKVIHQKVNNNEPITSVEKQFLADKDYGFLPSIIIFNVDTEK